MSRTLFFVLPLFGVLSTIAQARPAKSPIPPIPPQVLARQLSGVDSPVEFLVFRTVDSRIDCTSMGGPSFIGKYVSPEATIEMESNAGVQVSYANGTDLKNGLSTLPTAFQYAVLGVASFNGQAVVSPHHGTNYTAFGALPDSIAQESGFIAFPPSLPLIYKGFKMRLVADRHGLSDRAGDYSTQIVLNWTRF